uniref:Ubiquitin-like domain-containing protein n=1 Tax=Neolamprologus brichardi TaxID=32507 RepID=A0A3Q4G1D5_NEOBR
MGKIYQVVVSTFWGRKTAIDLGSTEEQFRSMTVLQLKEKIRKKFPDIPGKDNTETPNWRMIFTDKRLDYDDRLLSSYGIQHLSVIQLVKNHSSKSCCS